MKGYYLFPEAGNGFKIQGKREMNLRKGSVVVPDVSLQCRTGPPFAFSEHAATKFGP